MTIVNETVSTPPAMVAAFDVGSNSIKMTVARQADSGKIDEFLWRSETIRLGQGIEATNRLADDRIEAALDTLDRFAQEARAAGATRLVGVATEATRVAANGADFLAALTGRTGIEIQVISGDREAELTFLGLDGVTNLDGTVLVADIGGGSTELILAEDRRVEWSSSYALGSGRLTDRFLADDPPTAAQLATCVECARATLEPAPIRDASIDRLIVVGGTGEYLGRLIPPDSPRTPDVLQAVLDYLARHPSGTVAPIIGASQARARVLPAGIAIAEATARLSSPGELAVAQSGIRRGLLLAVFAGEL